MKAEVGKVILISGPPCSGKSTLIEELVGLVKNLHPLKYGQLILEELQRDYPSLTYENMRSCASTLVTREVVAEVDRKAIDKVAEIRKTSNILIESHTVTQESFGFRAVPYSVNEIQGLAISCIILLSPPPNILVARVAENPEGRKVFSRPVAKGFLELQTIYAVNYSVISGCPLFSIDSSVRSPELTSQVVRILESLGLSSI